MVGDQPLQAVDSGHVAVQQVELVLLGADRTLQAAQRIGGQQVRHPAMGRQEFLCGGGEPLAEGGHLGGHVVAAAGHGQALVFDGQPGQPGQGGHGAVQHQIQTATDLELFDVLGQVPRRHALVDVLMSGKGAELLDAGLHVVAGDTLPFAYRVQVDLIDHGAVIGDHPVGNLDAELPLGLHNSNPELALHDHLGLGRPQVHHGPAGVPGGEDVLH